MKLLYKKPEVNGAATAEQDLQLPAKIKPPKLNACRNVGGGGGGGQSEASNPSAEEGEKR